MKRFKIFLIMVLAMFITSCGSVDSLTNGLTGNTTSTGSVTIINGSTATARFLYVSSIATFVGSGSWGSDLMFNPSSIASGSSATYSGVTCGSGNMGIKVTSTAGTSKSVHNRTIPCGGTLTLSMGGGANFNFN